MMSFGAPNQLPVPDLEKCQGPKEIASKLQLSPIELDVYCRDGTKEKYYEEIRLSKTRPSSVRVVYKVSHPLRRAQKLVFLWLRDRTERGNHVHAYLHGFRRKRSIITNATPHIGKDVVTVVDISNFFGNLGVERVASGFQRLGCNEIVSVVLADLVTLRGSLPQGGRCSPILSNLVCSDLDAQIEQISQRHGVTASRYADDITFSGSEAVPLLEISQALHQCGLAPRPGSYRVMKRGGPQYVTGLCVADSHSVRVPRRIKRWLRLALHWANHDFDRHVAVVQRKPDKELNRLAGYVHFVASVEPHLAPELYRKLNRIRGAIKGRSNDE